MIERGQIGPAARTSGRGVAKVPQWVKVFALVALLGVGGFVVLHLTGLEPSHMSMATAKADALAAGTGK